MDLEALMISLKLGTWATRQGSWANCIARWSSNHTSKGRAEQGSRGRRMTGTKPSNPLPAFLNPTNTFLCTSLWCSLSPLLCHTACHAGSINNYSAATTLALLLDSGMHTHLHNHILRGQVATILSVCSMSTLLRTFSIKATGDSHRD